MKSILFFLKQSLGTQSKPRLINALHIAFMTDALKGAYWREIKYIQGGG